MRQLEGNLAVSGLLSFTVNVPGAGQQPAVLQDNVIADGCAWTAGTYLLMPLSAQPTISRPWTVFAWGIHLFGTLIRANPTARIVPRYGRLGKLFGALITGTSTPSLPGASSPYQGIPNRALSSAELLWDGNTDPPFPWWDNAVNPPTGGVVSRSFSLPQPIELGPGDALAIGLWLTPSLTQQTLITIPSGGYSIDYETHQAGR